MCDRPLKGFQPLERYPDGQYGPKLTKNGKQFYMICSPDVKYIWSDNHDRWHKSYDFNRADFSTVKNVVKDFILIPCGSCLSCRINRAGELADRCMLEMNYHDKACFVTLTYDSDHLIEFLYTRSDTGETGRSATLFKKHYMDFFKRLRKAFPGSDIRYVLCGEYGDTSNRPHYHAIIFGYRPSDLVAVSRNRRGQLLYSSEELNRLWKNGMCIVGDVTKDSANYVCRYVTKKLYSDVGKENYQAIGRIPPFIVTSKRPAIGRRWYEDNKDWCLDRQITYGTETGSRSFQAPRYFRKLADQEGLDTWKRVEIYSNREQANISQFMYQKSVNDVTAEELAEAKERQRNAINNAFGRNGI